MTAENGEELKCPRCGSNDISELESWLAWEEEYEQSRYRCNQCGFEGYREDFEVEEDG